MPHRPAVTLAIIPTTGRAKRAGQHLDLEEALGVGDNLVVLGKGLSTNGALWRSPRDGRWQRNERPGRTEEVVVLIDEGSQLSRGAIDELVSVLVLPGVAGVAPYTNHAGGAELFVPVPYRPHELEQRYEFLERFSPRADRAMTKVAQLAGACLALRRELVEAHGGLEGFVRRGYDLAALADEARASGELAVACRAYLHHPGGRVDRQFRHPSRTTALVSACLIVKDEEDNIARCLASIEHVADEIVVYDTGSTDRTRELAAARGARVVEGFWDDDFSRARNDALAHCSGEWVLWLDADEALVTEPQTLREVLRSTRTDIEAYVVTIDNLRGNEASTMLSHPACRLFRRAIGHWDGRVHEQIVARAGTRELFIVATDECRITHWGYVQSAISDRDKATRNVRTAFGDLAGGSALSLSDRLTSLARSYLLAGQTEEGVELAARAIALAERPSTKRLAQRSLIEGFLAAGRGEEALEESRKLAEITAVPTLAHAHAGTALNMLGRYEEALEEFALVIESVDEDGFSYEPTFAASGRAEALAGLGRDGEAATVLLDTLTSTGGLDLHLGRLIECLDNSGRDLAEIALAIAPGRFTAFVPQLLQLKAPAADRVLEALLAVAPDSLAVLAGAASLGPRLAVDRQLQWSARLRARGLGASCPLVQTTTDTSVDLATRVLAAASAAAMFGDARAEQALGALVLGLTDTERPDVFGALAQLAPASAARLSDFEPARRVASGPHPAAEPARTVLVVCRCALELRAYALAARLASHGHRVTVLQPQPAAPADELLAPHGVTVRGYHARDDWQAAAAGFIAHLYEEAPIEVVVASGRAEALTERICELVPGAAVLLESESSPTAQVACVEEDLELLFGELGNVPAAARSGLVLVGDLSTDPGARAEVERLAPVLRGRGEPVCFVGEDPERVVARELPLAIVAGPLADPTTWMRAARAIVLVSEVERTTWIELAHRCATPLIETRGRDADTVSHALDLPVVDAAVASEVACDASSSADPLAHLPGPYRRAGQVSGDRVALVGGVYGYESLATVNRELAVRLARAGGIDLSVYTPEPDPLAPDSIESLAGVHVVRAARPPEVDIEIRHQYPPDFSPSTGALVLIQPWEFGGLPAEWIGPLRDVVDELWVPTHFVRECAIESGVPAGRVHVVPNGVDTERLSPEGERLRLRTTKSTRLLFVGGLIDRKGIDALLETYCATFCADDDVCLVIKPFGSDGVYRNATLEPVVRRLASGDGPEIEIVDDHLSASEMAGLYRACDVLVHPYRGEGFALPVAEAMSCGLPVVVTNAGACLDFCDDTVGWLVDAYKRPFTPTGWTPSAGGTYWYEPSRAALALAMKAAVDNPDERLRRGAAGRARIAERFTWDAAAKAAATRIDALRVGARARDDDGPAPLERAAAGAR